MFFERVRVSRSMRGSQKPGRVIWSNIPSAKEGTFKITLSSRFKQNLILFFVHTNKLLTPQKSEYNGL